MRALDEPSLPSLSSSSSFVTVTPPSTPPPQQSQAMAAICSEPILSNELTFTVGSIVECTTCFEEVLTGEVLAFEYQNKILVLKIPSPTLPTHSNIICINLEYCSHVRLIKENPPDSNPNNIKLPELNTDKLDERARAAIKERKNLIEAYKNGVSSDGISLYLTLIKTIGGSVTLEQFPDDNKSGGGHCIVIKKNTKIAPPYSANCVHPVSSKGPMFTEAVKYARQLVEKFWRDQNKDPYTLSPLPPSISTLSLTEKSSSGSGSNVDPSTSNNNNGSNNSSTSSKESSPSNVTISTLSPCSGISSPVRNSGSPGVATTNATTKTTNSSIMTAASIIVNTASSFATSNTNTTNISSVDNNGGKAVTSGVVTNVTAAAAGGSTKQSTKA